MAIVCAEYYLNIYCGEDIAAADFPRYEMRAENLIAQYTGYGYERALAELTGKGLMKAAQRLTELYSNAICAQIEYFILNGISVASEGLSGASYTLGKISVSNGAAGGATGARSMICPAAVGYLERTGLLYRGIACASDHGGGWLI